MRDIHPCCRTAFLALCLFVLTIILISPATALMAGLSPSYIAEQSDAIAIGTITSVESRWNDAGTEIETVVAFSVDETLAGELSQNPILIVPGGTVDGMTYWVEDVPVFFPGENVGLFLKQLPGGEYRTVGLSQGVVPLADQSTERSVVSSSLTPEQFSERVHSLLQGETIAVWTTDQVIPGPFGTAEITGTNVVPMAVEGVPAGTGTAVWIPGPGFGTKASRESPGDVAFYFTSDSSTNYWIYGTGRYPASGWQEKNPNEIVSWTDSEIVCRVPTGTAWCGQLYRGSASSGPVFVIHDDGATVSGPYSLAIPFGWGRVRWQGTVPVVSYYVNPPSVSGALAAAQNAAAAWTSVQGSSFSFAYAGTTSSTATGKNGRNEILWADIAIEGVLAQAGTWYSGEYVTECDIKFNTRYSWSTNPGYGQFDIETVCLHELGHWIQLLDLYGDLPGYPSDSAKVMYGWVDEGQIKRTLTDSDKAGVCWIYPGETPAPAPAITGIAPSSGYNDCSIDITNLAGANFQNEATVRLTRTGQADIVATGVSVLSQSQIACTFDLTGRDAGIWDVTVINPDGQSAVLQQGFTIIDPVPLTLASSKDSVVRGNGIVITIAGESSHRYYIYIKAAEDTSPAEYPFIAPGQSGVSNIGAPGPVAVVNASAGSQANVTTTAVGTRPIQFNTNSSTGAGNYTIEVIDWTDPSRSASVTVRVEQGKVTIVAAGTGTYYFGDELIISGSNTDSSTVYLFIKGQNLPNNGSKLDNVTIPSITGNASTFTRVEIMPDQCWEYRWDTSSQANGILQARTYTIYAAAAPRVVGDLEGTPYSTSSVALGPLTPDFQANITSGQVPLTVQFTASSTSNPASRSWTFGDGATSTGWNPTYVHTYTTPGTYNVSLAVVTNYGATNTTTKADYITVTSGTAPLINAITPGYGYLNRTVAITNLSGARFQDGMTVTLIRAGEPDLTATEVSVGSSSVITCTFDLAGAAPGKWNVTVANPGGEHGTLIDGFTVCPKGDLNHNGEVDIGDVAKAAYMVVGKEPEDPEADFNGNGHVDIGDASKIAYFHVGLIIDL